MAEANWGRTVRRLVEAGLVDGDAALAGGVGVQTASRSNQVGILSVDGTPLLVLKRHAAGGGDVDPYQAEFSAYCWLASRTATSCLAPRLVVVEDRVLVTEALARFRTLHEALASGDDDAPRRLEALGRCLALLHAAGAERGALAPRRPWVLGLAEGKVPTMLAADPEIAPLVAEIASEPPLMAALRQFSQAWRARAPMHGDVKFDNVLVAQGASAAEPRIVLLDWELAGLGLPVWDLAGLLEGVIVPELRAADIETALGEACRSEPAIAAYRAAAGPGLAPDDRELAVATVVRLLQATVQLHAMRQMEPECAEGARRVLAGARALAGRIADGAAGPPWVA